MAKKKAKKKVAKKAGMSQSNAKKKTSNAVRLPGEVDAETQPASEEYLAQEHQVRQLIRKKGGLRKGLTSEQIDNAQNLIENVLERKETFIEGSHGYEWDFNVRIKGYPRGERASYMIKEKNAMVE